MKTKSMVWAVIIGLGLGILVIRPLSTLAHLSDPHAGGVSWIDYLANVYSQIFSFNDVGPTLLSMLGGIMAAVLVVMTKFKKRHGQSHE